MSPNATTGNDNGSKATIGAGVIPAETAVELMLISPIMAEKAKVGDFIYAKTIEPVAVESQMVIPTGSFVQGVIVALTKPTKKLQSAELVIRYDKLIYINGYSVELNASRSALSLNESDWLIAASDLHLAVTTRNDVLFDNGTQFKMNFQSAVKVNAAQVKDAVQKTKPMTAKDLKLRSATSCVPYAGTPGDPGTVIHGTAPIVIPGTPPTVIPGGPGMPDTVIPGTPDTVIPGTPDSVVGDTAGTPAVYCPQPSLESTKPKAIKASGVVELTEGVEVGGVKLEPGIYEANWDGAQKLTAVVLKVKGKSVASAQAERVYLAMPPAKSFVELVNAGGVKRVNSLRFSGLDYALYFEANSK